MSNKWTGRTLELTLIEPCPGLLERPSSLFYTYLRSLHLLERLPVPLLGQLKLAFRDRFSLDQCAFGVDRRLENAFCLLALVRHVANPPHLQKSGS